MAGKPSAHPRAEVIRRDRADILGRPDLLARLPGLRGKVLTCWSRPLACHGDVLVKLLAGLEHGGGDGLEGG